MGHKKNFLRVRGGSLNTFIGGIGATTTTAAALETLLGLSSGNVQDFSIDGSNNISCRVTVNWILPDGVFNNNDEITYFRAYGGKLYDSTGTIHFNDCLLLEDVILEGYTGSFPNVYFCQALILVDYLNSTGDNASFRGCNNLVTVKLPPTNTNAPTLAYQDCFDLKYIDLSYISSIGGSSAFEDTDSIEYYNLSNITHAFTISWNYIFGYITGVDSVLDISNIPSIINSSNGTFRYTTKVKKCFLHNCTIYNAGLGNNGSPAHFVISKATRIGTATQDYSLVTNQFLSWTPFGARKIYFHNNMATINGGGPSADINYLISRGFTIVYVTDYTAPSAISDLAATNITGTTFDLTFSTPSSTNAIQHYDIYIDFQDGRGFILRYSQEISASGGTITIPSGYSGIGLKVKARTIDEFYNMSGFSNEITVSIP